MGENTKITRRDALVFGASAAAAALIPVAAAPPSLALAAPAAPAWCLGTPGEMNWLVIFAPTEREAREQYLEEAHDVGCEGCSIIDCECFGAPEARREPALDQFFGASVPDAALLTIGWTVNCTRCGYETDEAACAQVIGGRVVCDDCLTQAERDEDLR